ncbi:hypothetical protein [Methanobrevibacter sp.]|uniref:hypothetical protein n=1 Tax=Methanobrevibacter sp. TaxID=66852 RepID=UPI0025D99665|nr:hypothetical protein [Methanobrevibacter sp.]MBQ2832588.1 hypothetical protein [Methanobrevibacter sp.]
MYDKKRCLVELSSGNEESLLRVINDYGLIPAGSTEILDATKPVRLLDQNRFIVDLDFVSSFEDFEEEVNKLGFDFVFRDIDTHEEITF